MEAYSRHFLMKFSEQDLKSAVQSAVTRVVVGPRIKVLSVEEDGEDGNLRVEISISKSQERLPKDVLLRIVNAASDAIAQTGEERFPKVVGRLAATQEFAA